MAFVHCHNCEWQQDDFWHWGYNPLRCALQRIPLYIVPRKVPFTYNERRLEWRFSWGVLLFEWARLWRRFRKMNWWTYESWKKAENRGCPKCNSQLCID